MGIRVECDWCRQAIKAGEPYVTIEVDGKLRKGAAANGPVDVGLPARVYCGADRYTDDDPAFSTYIVDGWGHRPSCASIVLSLLNGNPYGRADMGMEWRLVPVACVNLDRLLDAPIEVLDVSRRTMIALKKAGVESVHELASMTRAQWLAINGIAHTGVREIVASLNTHHGRTAKTVAAKIEALAVAS